MRLPRDWVFLIFISAIIIGMPLWFFAMSVAFDGNVAEPLEYGFRDVMGRNPTSFRAPDLKSFMSGAFQSRLEKASSDRLPAFTIIIKSYRDLARRLNKITLKWLPSSWAPVYPVGGKIVAPWDSSRLLEIGLRYSSRRDGNLCDKANYYNMLAREHSQCRFFVIPVVTAGDCLSSLDAFYKDKTEVLAGERYARHFSSFIDRDIRYDWIGRRLKPVSTLNLFYNSDHHFSMRGAHYVYCRVIENLLSSEEPRGVQKWVTLSNVVFRGSYARRAGAFRDITDVLDIVQFKLPTLSIRTSKNETRHGNLEEYLRGKCSRKLFVDHYAKYHGGNRGIVQYSCPSAPRRRILVISDSYDNPIEPLIASHYRNAYIINRHSYKQETGHAPNISEIITKYDVDDVLFFGKQDSVLGLTES